MELIITVPDEAKAALEQRARERGYHNVTTYVERLVTTDLLTAQSFDDILAPVRQAFHASGMAENELDALFEDAREEVHQEQKSTGK